MTEMELLREDVKGLSNSITRMLNDHESRIRVVESLHDKQKGAWAVIVIMLTTSAAIGGIIANTLRLCTLRATGG